MIRTPTANKHGRVGVKRRRFTTNQQLRQRNASLERRHQQMMEGLYEVYKMTAKSKTGVARHVHDYVAQYIEAE